MKKAMDFLFGKSLPNFLSLKEGSFPCCAVTSNGSSCRSQVVIPCCSQINSFFAGEIAGTLFIFSQQRILLRLWQDNLPNGKKHLPIVQSILVVCGPYILKVTANTELAKTKTLLLGTDR